MASVLDNPIWNALCSVDSDKNIGTNDLSFLDADVAPFIGMQHWDEESQKKILDNAPSKRSWFLLIADEVNFIDELEITFTIPLYQFVCNKLNNVTDYKNDITITSLNSSHVDDMLALTALTKPGPFMKRTIEFGNYHGIFEGDKLVAMGGERLHLDRFTEISAICTHPDFRGHGYGAAITHHLAQSVIQKGQIPFLHARVDNIKAIDIYERLGFEIRSTIQFYIIRRK
ncbi:MAG: GNAT family N-acetyltransferase [Bacteroidota bacterium]|nr:GNAT family N-acetyltransferase [Bacteroidota bacterium]